jgi:hypothetical protein
LISKEGRFYGEVICEHGTASGIIDQKSKHRAKISQDNETACPKTETYGYGVIETGMTLKGGFHDPWQVRRSPKVDR